MTSKDDPFESSFEQFELDRFIMSHEDDDLNRAEFIAEFKKREGFLTSASILLSQVGVYITPDEYYTAITENAFGTGVEMPNELDELCNILNAIAELLELEGQSSDTTLNESVVFILSDYPEFSDNLRKLFDIYFKDNLPESLRNPGVFNEIADRYRMYEIVATERGVQVVIASSYLYNNLAELLGEHDDLHDACRTIASNLVAVAHADCRIWETKDIIAYFKKGLMPLYEIIRTRNIDLLPDVIDHMVHVYLRAYSIFHEEN